MKCIASNSCKTWEQVFHHSGDDGNQRWRLGIDLIFSDASFSFDVDMGKGKEGYR